VLSEYEAGVRGKGYAAIAKRHKITASTIQGWLKNKDRYRQQHLTMTRRGVVNYKRRLAGGGQKPLWPEIEQKCLKWILNMNSNGLRVLGKELKMKARNFATELGIVGFTGTNKWLQLFKARHNLVTCRMPTNKLVSQDSPEPI